MNALRRHWRLVVLAFAAGLILIAILPGDLVSGPLGDVFTPEGAKDLVSGAFGPLAVIVLMTVAVVLSPIPSAPIALAAGAAYGHYWGTVYVAVGAELGAVIAFSIARILGRETLVRWFGHKVDVGLLGSQNVLTFAVFASRLMPFVSFDMISYAAGLTCLKFWRFAVATLAGIIPASFFLAHVGGMANASGYGAVSVAALGLGLVTGVPLLLAFIRPKIFRSKVQGENE